MFLHMGVICSYVYALNDTGLERGVDFLELSLQAVMSLCGCTEPKTALSNEQQELLVTEPSFGPHMPFGGERCVFYVGPHVCCMAGLCRVRMNPGFCACEANTQPTMFHP